MYKLFFRLCGGKMENILLCLNAVLPIFLIFALGFAARHLNLMDIGDVLKMNKIAFKVFLPFMMFANIYNAELEAAIRPDLILFALGSVLVIYLLSIAASLLYTKDKSKQGVIIQGIFRSNYVIFGIPVAANLYGEGNIATAALLSAVAVPLFNVLAVFTLEFYSDRRTGVKSLLKGIVTNPLILGAAAALVMKAMPFGLPAAVHEAVSDLGQVATPLSLVILGATFRFGAVRKNLRWLSIGIIGKTVVVPLLTIPAAILCGFRGIALLSLTILFASPTAVTSFTMAEAAGHDGELAGQQVVFSSIISLFTVFLWIFALKSFALI